MIMDLTERRISGETIFTGRVFTIERDEVVLPGGLTASRELVRHNGGVGVLAIDDRDNVILVRQYRYGAGRVLLEIPAGKLEPGEEPLSAGIRELREETGYAAAALRSLGQILPTAAYDTEIIHLYLAEGLTLQERCLDEGEFVEVQPLPLRKAVAMAAKGEIDDAKSVAALLRYWIQRNGV